MYTVYYIYNIYCIIYIYVICNFMQYFMTITHKSHAQPSSVEGQTMVLTRGQSLRDPHRHGEGLQLQPQQL